MSKQILVLGGTRFFGKRLVNLLLAEGHQITVGTRGQTAATFDAPVEWLILDRQDKESMAAVLSGRAWDVVYDQICFGPTDAAEALEVFGDRVGKYIFTSSLAVYDQNKHAGLVEAEFDPATYPIQMGRVEKWGYAEGKRLAEAVLHQRAPFPVASVRFPIVFGEDDYTERLLNPVREVVAGRPLKMSAEAHEMCLISSAEAADFLAWLATSPLAGPVNACSNGTITPQALVGLIEQATGQTAVVEITAEPARFSVVTLHDTWTLDTQLAQSHGYQFANLGEWLVPLIEHFS